MNTIESIEKLTTIFDKAIFGIILAAFLTPLITSVIEKRKRKREIKVELIKAISELFNYFKLYSYNNTYSSYYTTRGNLQTKEENYDQELAKTDHNQGEVYDERNQTIIVTIYSIESRISGLLAEVEIYYSKEAFNKLDSIIMTILEHANNENYLAGFRFEKKTLEELKTSNISNHIIPTQEKMERDANKYRAKIREII